jgi:hypothetical protein
MDDFFIEVCNFYGSYITNEDFNVHNQTNSYVGLNISSPNEDNDRIFALTSLQTNIESWTSNVMEELIEPDPTREKRILKLIENIIKSDRKIDYIILPELSLPRNLLLHLIYLLTKNNISLVTGIDYSHIDKDSVINQLVYSLCIKSKYGKKAICLFQDKLKPAQSEEVDLNKVSNKKLDSLFKMKLIINHSNFIFSGLICNDLLDINNRANLRGKIDALFVIAWNKDTETYDHLINSSANDIHAFIFLVNNREYGDTRLRAPYKENYERDVVRVKGGLIDYFVVAKVETKKLREFQKLHISPNKGFKPIPTGFDMAINRKK